MSGKLRICDGRMPVLIVSIPGSPRRQRITTLMHSLGVPFRFCDGIVVSNTEEVGGHLRNLGLDNVNIDAVNLPYGDLGCMLAHLYVCKMIVDECIPWAMVLEDDVDFNPAIERDVATMDLSPYVCSDWTFIHPNYGFSMLGQIVTYVGAKKVMQQASMIVTCGYAIDIVLFSSAMKKDFSIATCYGSEFWLVDQKTPYNTLEFSERMQLNR